MIDQLHTPVRIRVRRPQRRCEIADVTGRLSAGEESMLCLHLERIINEVTQARAACDQLLSEHIRRHEYERERVALHLCSRLDGLLDQAEETFLNWTDKLEM